LLRSSEETETMTRLLTTIRILAPLANSLLSAVC
jgi:hypothetical protein